MANIRVMNKTFAMPRNAKTGQIVVAGRASDGVKILRQIGKPSNFTRLEAAKAVDRVKSGKAIAGGTKPLPSNVQVDSK